MAKLEPKFGSSYVISVACLPAMSHTPIGDLIKYEMVAERKKLEEKVSMN
jgi:hypothetical protein